MPNALKSNLKQAWLRQINKEYKNILWQYNLKIPHAGLSFTEDKKVLAKWNPNFYQILINSDIILKYSWFSILCILKHEICHQMVYEADKKNYITERAHGALFNKMAEKIALEHFFRKAEINLDSYDILNDSNSNVLNKINKILSLTESNFKGEQEAATSALFKLLAKYNLSNYDILYKDFKRKIILLNKMRLNFTIKKIAQLLNKYFLVEIIFIPYYSPKLNREEKAIEILGRVKNLEIAEYVFNYLNEKSSILWKSYKKNNKLAKKNSFYFGLFKGFEENLLKTNKVELNKNKLIELSEKEIHNFKDLVLIKKNDIKLAEYFSKIHPKISKNKTKINSFCKQSMQIGYTLGKELKILNPMKEFKKILKLSV